MLLDDTVTLKYKNGPSEPEPETINLSALIDINPACLTSTNGQNDSPLHCAICGEDALTTHQLVSSPHAKPNVGDAQLRTALHLVAQADRPDKCALLLAAPGCDPNAQDKTGKTPLHLACISTSPASLDTVVGLLHAGSNPNARDKLSGSTPLHGTILFAARHQINASFAVESKIHALLDAEADIDAPDECGCAPIMYAAVVPPRSGSSSSNKDEYTPLFRVLHSRGARLDVRDKQGRGLLQYAAAYGNITVHSYMLDTLPGLENMNLRDIDAPEVMDRYEHLPRSLTYWRELNEPSALWEDAGMRPADDNELAAYRKLVCEIERRKMWDTNAERSAKHAASGFHFFPPSFLL